MSGEKQPGASPLPVAKDVLGFQTDAREIEERPVPPLARATLYVLLALIVSAVLWASLSHVERIVTAPGKLLTLSPKLVVQPLETSIIRAIEVEVGDVVKQGDTLVTLDPTFTEADVAQLTVRLDSYAAQMARLTVELSGAPFAAGDAQRSRDEELQGAILEKRQAEFAARLRTFDERIAGFKAAIETNARDQEGLAARWAVLKEIEDMREELFRAEHGSKLLALDSRNDRLEVERDFDFAVNRATELQHEHAGVEAERQAFIEEWRKGAAEEFVAVKRESDNIAEQLNKAEKRKTMVVLRAPADAIVLDIAARSVGSVVREAEPLVTLVPLDAALEAEVEVGARDIGHVRTGDTARIKLDAFPFQRHDTLAGEVRTISEDAFAREGEAGSQPFYRARIALTSSELRAVPEGFRLIPGMSLTAEIKVGTRTVISYFLYPVIRVLDEGMREP